MRRTLKYRLCGGAALGLVTCLASANTPTAWSNPLLKDLPYETCAFISVDLGGTQAPLVNALKIVEGAGGSSLGKLAAQGFASLNLSKEFQDAFDKGNDQRAILYNCAPYARGGFEQGVVAVFELKPGNTMAAALKSSMVHDIDGVPYADFKTVVAHVEGNALILTANPKLLPIAVKPLRGGSHMAIGRLSSVYDSIEPTAEIIGWLSPGMTASAMVPTPAVGSDSFAIATGRGFGYSLGLHAKGISVSAGPLSFTYKGKLVDLSAFRPLPAGFMNTLPGGPYLLTCISDPWPFVDKLSTLGVLPGDAKKTIDQVDAAARGNYVFGIYPTRMKAGQPEGFDLLLEVRRSKPATKGYLAKKVREVLPRLLEGDAKVLEPIKIDGADSAYRLNSMLATVLRAGIKSAAKSAGGFANLLAKDKNILCAGVGGSLLIATSEPVLRKAVAALAYGRSTLAYDPKYAELVRSGKPKNWVFAISLTRTLQVAAKAMMSAGTGVKGDTAALQPFGMSLGMVGGLFSGWPDPLMVQISTADNGLSGRIFVPVDFGSLALLTQGMAKPSR